MAARRHHCRFRQGAGLLAVVLAVGLAGPAHADPTDPGSPRGHGGRVPSSTEVRQARADVAAASAREAALERELAAARAEVEAVRTRAEEAAETYNEARALLEQRTQQAKRAQLAAQAAQRRAGKAQLALQQLAAAVYMQGGSLDGLEFIVGLSDPADVARRAADLEAIGGFRAATVEDAQARVAAAQTARRAAAQALLQQRAAAARAQTAFAEATKAEETARQEEAALAARRQAALVELAQLRRTSLAVEQARQRGVEARLDQAGSAAARRGASGSAPTDLPAPSTEAAARAIAYATAQLGKPYRWAAEGPDTFDCSGLTMKAWQAGGRSLWHYSKAQYNQTARVPIGELQPGDLVFFGSSPASIHHVGLYVGQGRMIEAPHTGAFVRYSSIYRSSLLPYGGRP